MNEDVFLVFALAFFIFVIHYVTKDHTNTWHQRFTEKLMFDEGLGPHRSRQRKGRHRT